MHRLTACANTHICIKNVDKYDCLLIFIAVLVHIKYFKKKILCVKHIGKCVDEINFASG